MKRRKFLLGAASTTGLLLSAPLRAEDPCPPKWGNRNNTSCSPEDLEADWQSRIAGPGVLAYHDFRNDAEVNRFRWQGGIGNDVSGLGDGSCRRITSDGLTGGGCMEIAVPAGGTSKAGWIRPFSALTGATNGRGIDDPGATLRQWNVQDDSDYTGKWKDDFIAHPDYQSRPGWSFLGDEIYIQFRVKMTGGRSDSGQPNGKLAFIGITGTGSSHVTPNQEIVLQSLRKRELRAYTNFGSAFNSALTDPQANANKQDHIKQPGGAYNNSCINNTSCANCYCYPLDEWVTVLIHLKAGRHGTTLSDIQAQNTQLEIMIAESGDTEYTTIYSKNDFVFRFKSDMAQGWNAFEPSAYMNNVAANPERGWEQRYDQIIFSRSAIPCPLI